MVFWNQMKVTFLRKIQNQNIKKNHHIYILHYLNGVLNVAYALIDDIKNYKRENHYFSKEESLFYNPILSLKTFKVIGILATQIKK